MKKKCENCLYRSKCKASVEKLPYIGLEVPTKPQSSKRNVCGNWRKG